MPILTLSHARLGFGERLLLDDAELVLEPREHVALVGRNGSGKSTLLAALAGIVDLDDGERWLMPGVRVALLAQEPAQDEQRTVYESVALGLGDEGKTLAAYHDALALLARSPHDERTQLEVQRLHDEVEQRGWRSGHRIEGVLSRLELDPDARVGTLSGGWQKRVALATALVRDPEVLLLDEPTNHLDIAAIEWLEALIRAFGGAVVCVTHDRRFLDAIAQRIVELDRGKLRSYPGVFAEYRARKALEEHEEALANARMDRLLAQEEAWIRKGVEARRTRNEGRVLRLEHLRGARAERRERAGQVRFDMADAERSGRLVAELLNVSKAYGGRTLIRDFTTRILRGDRIGLIGPNGAGKTTLLKLILGDIAPDAGTVRRGTQLQVAYFDQFREQLDPEATLADSISPGADFIEIGGTRRHVITYLGEFMFPPSRARSPVRSLSGGERNRLLLARLFARPANVLVLDEPTNDLDVDTLELLEALLQDYAGTLFLVSHDRAFLDNVVTQTIAFEGDGLLREHVGGYSDWEAWKRRSAAAAADAARSVARTPAEPARSTSPRRGTFAGASRSADAPRTLSGRERAELESLPDTIDTLEQDVSRTQAALSDPSLYRDRPDEVMRLRETLTAAEEALATAYARWEALERRASGT